MTSAPDFADAEKIEMAAQDVPVCSKQKIRGQSTSAKAIVSMLSRLNHVSMHRAASIDGRDGNDLVPDASETNDYSGRNMSAEPKRNHKDESDMRSISWTPDRESSQHAKGRAVLGK